MSKYHLLNGIFIITLSVAYLLVSFAQLKQALGEKSIKKLIRFFSAKSFRAINQQIELNWGSRSSFSPFVSDQIVDIVFIFIQYFFLLWYFIRNTFIDEKVFTIVIDRKSLSTKICSRSRSDNSLFYAIFFKILNGILTVDKLFIKRKTKSDTF